MRFADFLDIAIIAFLIYFVLLWLRQKSSRTMAMGVAVIAAIYVLAHSLDLYLTSQFFQAGLTAILVTLVILFQTDIRRALERLVTMQMRTRHGILSSSQTLDVLVESAARLAHDQVGALLVLKGLENLDRHIRGGIALNGRVSMPVLHAIFQTASPSHDGAVIIGGEWIERYAAYLPLSQHLKEGTEAGTRHAAAIGLSEVCDALIVVVSEERGTISVAERGELDMLGSAGELKSRLEKFYARVTPVKTATSRLDWFRNNLLLKIAAVGCAALLWYLLARQDTMVLRPFTIPVECRNIPPSYIIDKPDVTEIHVSLSGQERLFNFNPAALSVAIDLGNVRDGMQEYPLSKQNIINLPPNLRVTQIDPRKLRVTAYATTVAMMPVRVMQSGSLPPGIKKVLLRCEPESVQVRLPRNLRDQIASIRTEPIVLEDVSGNTTVKAELVLPNHIQLEGNTGSAVKVKIEVVN